jgi:hypothetical protein
MLLVKCGAQLALRARGRAPGPASARLFTEQQPARGAYGLLLEEQPGLVKRLVASDKTARHIAGLP